jgi:hypothetical protein
VTVVDVPRRARNTPPAAPLGARNGRASSVALFGLVVLGIAFRLLWSARNGASFDESFSAMIGRHSLGGIFDALRSGDSHPPLDYLLRAPLARAGAGDWIMRAPSLLFSAGALAMFAWWMRNRGVAGLVAVALMAVSPFQIMYGGEARMYALLELLGVAAAMLAEHWLRDPQRWHSTVAGALVLVAVFDHVSGWLLAAGLLAVAGWRTGASARRWRLAIVCALGIWIAVWGTSFLAQSRVTHASWIDRTSWGSIGDAVTQLLTNQQGVVVLVVAAVAGGVVVVMATDRVLGRVVLACGVLPVALAAAVGLFVPFFIARTVTIAAWVPCLAVGALVEWVWRRSFMFGVLAATIIACLVLPATLTFLDRHWEYDASIDHVLGVARSGDVVATIPDWYGPLVDWRVGVRAYGAVRPVELSALRSAHAIQLDGGAPSGRVWVLSFAGDRRTFPSLAHCAQDWSDGVIVVSCVRTPEVPSTASG